MPLLTSRTYNKKEYAGNTVNFPFIGVATFDADGNLEVEEVHLESFLEATKDSFNFKVVGVETAKSGSQDAVDAELEEFKAQLDLLSETDLLTLVKESEDIALKQRATMMSNDQIKKALTDKYKLELEALQATGSPDKVADTKVENKPTRGRPKVKKDTAKRDEFIAKVRSGEE